MKNSSDSLKSKFSRAQTKGEDEQDEVKLIGKMLYCLAKINDHARNKDQEVCLQDTYGRYLVK